MNSVREKIRRRQRAKLATVCTLIVCSLLSVVFIAKAIILRTEIIENKKEIAVLESQEQEMIEKNESLQAENHEGYTMSEIIDIARNKFQLVFPNEIIFIKRE